MSWRVPALLVLAVLASSESPGLGSTSQLVDPHPCSQLSGFTCSTLVVPLDHHGRRPGVLRLDVAAADNVGAPRGVLLFLAGGPGQPGVLYAAKIVQALA